MLVFKERFSLENVRHDYYEYRYLSVLTREIDSRREMKIILLIINSLGLLF